MRRRPVVVLVAALTVAVGGGAAWGWETRAVSLAGMAGHDRAGSAMAAVQQDDRLAAGLTGRSAGVAGRDLVGGSLAGLSQAIPAAQAVLDASAGKVADDSLRQQLAAAIASARTVGASPAPAVADGLAGRLTVTTAAVMAAQQVWQTAHGAP